MTRLFSPEEKYVITLQTSITMRDHIYVLKVLFAMRTLRLSTAQFYLFLKLHMVFLLEPLLVPQFWPGVF